MDSYPAAFVKEQAEAEILGQFRNEVERYERILNMMEALLGPVLLHHETSPGSTPEEVPHTTYHSEVMQLGRLNNRAEDLRSRIRL